MPPKIIFGEKRFSSLFDELENTGSAKPLLVCGNHFTKTDYFNLISEKFDALQIFTGIEPNPSVESVDKCAEIISSADCDSVIGIGGGSVLDASKVAACLKGSSKGVMEFYNKINVKEKVPFFSMPTTSGSGAEYTKYSVLTLPDSTKSTLRSEEFYAKTCIVDPELTYSLPKEITAASGVDAFCQAVESYWSKTATPVTKCDSTGSMTLSFNALAKAVNEPGADSRHDMALASITAAKAFDITGTTACHTLSYAFTKYYGLAHGFAVAITLPWFLKFYSDSFPMVGNSIAKNLDAVSVDDAGEKIISLLELIEAPTRLRDIGAKKQDFEKIVEMSLIQKPNNPKEHSENDLYNLLDSIF
ncbi:MAG: hypothetical protein COV47_00110 [Candidatus Diapherotrites archaeon CG11_big_fil_rev_8_21_14_0_20_37_9]|nr:MAG: hypothetical protein COV47_00110 [Candidatus Diapherotrites archaeon CG11_big_fil_rev_8_21_14_0_20_37_9]